MPYARDWAERTFENFWTSFPDASWVHNPFLIEMYKNSDQMKRNLMQEDRESQRLWYEYKKRVRKYMEHI